jgi:uncharacterized protein (DUF58 family)
MHFGEPISKFDFARRAAAAIAFLAVSSLDRIGIATFDSDLSSRIRALRGRGHLHSVLSFLEGLSIEMPRSNPNQIDLTDSERQKARESTIELPRDSSVTSLGATIRSYQRSRIRPGVVFVISDFLDPADFRPEMKVLVQRGFDLNLIQVLAPDELDPKMRGDLMLVDSESGAAREVTINERLLAAYKSALAACTASLESFCRARGIGYTLVAADVSFEDLLVKNLIQSRMAE